MNYYSNEDAKKLIELEIKTKGDIIKLIPSIIQVLQKFDGRVVNKRLERALQEQVDINLSLETDLYYERVTIKYYNHDSIITNSGCHAYLSSSFHNVVSSKKSYNNSNKRLVAQKVVDDLLLSQQTIQKEIEELTNSLNHVEEYQQKFDEYIEQINELRNSIPYEIRDYFGFNYI